MKRNRGEAIPKKTKGKSFFLLTQHEETEGRSNSQPQNNLRTMSDRSATWPPQFTLYAWTTARDCYALAAKHKGKTAGIGGLAAAALWTTYPRLTARGRVRASLQPHIERLQEYGQGRGARSFYCVLGPKAACKSSLSGISPPLLRQYLEPSLDQLLCEATIDLDVYRLVKNKNKKMQDHRVSNPVPTFAGLPPWPTRGYTQHNRHQTLTSLLADLVLWIGPKPPTWEVVGPVPRRHIFGSQKRATHCQGCEDVPLPLRTQGHTLK